MTNNSRYDDEFKGRFWSKVFIPLEDSENQCWNWTAGVTSKGYGSFTIKFPKTELAHRVAYRLKTAVIKKGYAVKHICGNNLCQNPNHLKEVKKTDIKGNLKFTEPIRRKIFADYDGGMGWSNLMKKHKISRGSLGNILNKREK